MKYNGLRTIIIAVFPALFAAIFAASCGHGGGEMAFVDTIYAPLYASGLEILGDSATGSALVVTRSPWQGADSTASTRLLVLHGDAEAPAGFDGQVLHDPARRVVCMSSSYIAMLEALDAADRVVGVSGIDFITNPHILAGRDTIADVGYDGNIDYERLVACRPDIVLLYGVGGASMMEGKLRELGIPYAYIGEYLEESPLGKAEWLVAVAEIIGEREKGREVFNAIPRRYEALKELASAAAERPRVMINSPYRDQWMMASADSYVAHLIADAGGEYVFNGRGGNSSTAIDMEEAYRLASDADCWLNPGQVASLDELKRMLPRFAGTRPVKNGNVWNTTLHATPGGGNDYWESGVVHPDLVLSDLVAILHPAAVADTVMNYYKRL